MTFVFLQYPLIPALLVLSLVLTALAGLLRRGGCAAAVLAAVLSGRNFGWSIASLVIFSVDTLVAAWLFAASSCSLGFLPSFMLHAAAEIFLVLAVGCGRSLKNAECGVRGALRLAFGRIS